MKHKVAELEGALLDAAVALAKGFIRTRSEYGDKPELWDTGGGFYRVYGPIGALGDERWAPSTHWQHGGPIIERERIDVGPKGEVWTAHAGRGFATGPTPLIAAMRAFVASKFGEEVELPAQ